MKLLQWIRVFGCSNTIFSFTPTWLGIILNTRKEMHDKKKKKKNGSKIQKPTKCYSVNIKRSPNRNSKIR